MYNDPSLTLVFFVAIKAMVTAGLMWQPLIGPRVSIRANNMKPTAMASIKTVKGILAPRTL